jgi:hypothetical protein
MVASSLSRRVRIAQGSSTTAGGDDMVRVTINHHPLTATAALVWNGDLPRPLQQVLFETADGVTSPTPAGSARRA